MASSKRESRLVKMVAPRTVAIPPHSKVAGVPIRLARVPASKLPKGVMPKKDMV